MSEPRVRTLGCQPYLPVWQDMQRFTDTRDHNTADEIWLLEHEPVYTQGLNGDARHLLAAGDIPVVQVDRGGQVTYHGPGQLTVYTLLDIERLGLGVRSLVSLLEDSLIAYLAGEGITAAARSDAPGVYVEGRKIASLGLKIRKGCCYHGLALNVDMDLGPFTRINPCGYAGLQMTQMRDCGSTASLTEVQSGLTTNLLQRIALHRQSASKTVPDNDDENESSPNAK